MTSALRSVPRGVWALATAAFAVRLAVAFAVVDLRAEAYQEFGTIARHLFAGDGYAFLDVPGYGPVPSAWMPPGYVGLLAAFLGIGDVALRNSLLLAFQSAVGAAAVPLAFAVGRAWYPATPRAAWGAAVVMAAFPPIVYAASTYGATVFYHAGLLGVLALLARDQRPTTGWAVGLGVLLAALVVVRTEAALLVGLLLGAEAVRGHVRGAAVAAAVCAVALAPWVVRNAVVLGAPTLSTSGGLNLYRGNNPDGVGSWASAEVAGALLALPPGPGLEIARQRVHTRAAVDYVRTHPGAAVVRAGKKVAGLWGVEPSDPRARHPLALGSWVGLLVLTLVGLTGARPPSAFWIVVGQATLVAAVFFALPRHQVLLAVALVPVAGHGLSRLAGHRFLTPGPPAPAP